MRRRYAPEAVAIIEALAAQGHPPAAFICEPFYGNAGGIALPDGYLAACTRPCAALGGLAIADEVQVGLRPARQVVLGIPGPGRRARHRDDGQGDGQRPAARRGDHPPRGRRAYRARGVRSSPRPAAARCQRRRRAEVVLDVSNGTSSCSTTRSGPGGTCAPGSTPSPSSSGPDRCRPPTSAVSSSVRSTASACTRASSSYATCTPSSRRPRRPSPSATGCSTSA